MIRELTKSYLRKNNSTIVHVCPGDSVHDIECLLLDTYHCYYWNGGDYHQDSIYHTSDIYEYSQYFLVSYNKKNDILIVDMAAFHSEPSHGDKLDMITSKMLLRERKLKRLRRTIKRRNSC